jgi:hypothetical protein
MKSFLISALSLILLVACSPGIPANTGLEGQVFIGPICPVVQKGQNCPDQPYQATLVIQTTANRQIIQIYTDTRGNFHLALAPGSYILHLQTLPNRPYPTGRDQKFNVVAGQFTQVKFVLDSGIR